MPPPRWWDRVPASRPRRRQPARDLEKRTRRRGSAAASVHHTSEAETGEHSEMPGVRPRARVAGRTPTRDLGQWLTIRELEADEHPVGYAERPGRWARAQERPKRDGHPPGARPGVANPRTSGRSPRKLSIRNRSGVQRSSICCAIGRWRPRSPAPWRNSFETGRLVGFAFVSLVRGRHASTVSPSAPARATRVWPRP